MSEPKNNLDTYKLLYMIKGILTLCFSLFFIIYAGVGLLVSGVLEDIPNNEMPFNPGYIFLIIGGIGFVFTVVLGILTLVSQKFIKERRNYNYVFVMGIINALTGVLGIVLCIFFLIEITKPEVKKLFWS